MIAEKRLSVDPVAAEDSSQHLPIFADQDGTECVGLWAIVDHLEGNYPEHPLTPESAAARAESLKFVDWALGPLHENVTRKIVYEKASQRFTGAGAKRAPDMILIRDGREALRAALGEIGAAADRNGYLAVRECTLGDLAVAAHISALDYFGEVPWAEHTAAAEWYMKMKAPIMIEVCTVVGSTARENSRPSEMGSRSRRFIRCRWRSSHTGLSFTRFMMKRTSSAGSTPIHNIARQPRSGRRLTSG